MLQKIAYDNLGAVILQCFAALVLLMDESPNRVPSVEKMANGIDACFSGSPGD
ncbi:hypothetical protein D3C80_2150560 [compost metagenome]